MFPVGTLEGMIGQDFFFHTKHPYHILWNYHKEWKKKQIKRITLCQTGFLIFICG